MLSDIEGKLANDYVENYVVYDLETTGTSWKTDKVIEISAIKVIDGKVVDEFTSLVNPGMPIPYYATAVNGITDDMVEDAPCFEEVLEQFIKFIEDLPLVGHNIHTFDMKFIYRDCKKYFGKVIDNDYIDTLKLSRNYLPQMRHHKLTDMAEHYQISTTGAHRALNDCRMNQQVYVHLGEEMKAAANGNTTLKMCPRCASPLKIRNGIYGEFYGCTNYPNCRYTENI